MTRLFRRTQTEREEKNADSFHAPNHDRLWKCATYLYTFCKLAAAVFYRSRNLCVCVLSGSADKNLPWKHKNTLIARNIKLFILLLFFFYFVFISFLYKLNEEKKAAASYIDRSGATTTTDAYRKRQSLQETRTHGWARIIRFSGHMCASEPLVYSRRTAGNTVSLCTSCTRRVCRNTKTLRVWALSTWARLLHAGGGVPASG